MGIHSLLDPILDQGLLHTNFFEGRLLTAQDLRDQQQAERERTRRLGRAVGEGIIEGLEVLLENDGADGNVPVVAVKRGLAINGEGEIIGLPEHDVQVALSRSVSVAPTTETEFYACAGPPTTKHLPNGVGVYLLVMSPASGYRERAPKSGLGDEGIVKGCGSRYVQEGVRFHLTAFNPVTFGGVSDATRALLKDDLLSQSDPASGTDLVRISRLRNLLAHICFGTEELAGLAVDPIAHKEGKPLSHRYGALDALREAGELLDCDVPLALLYWTLDGIAFVDLWSVRRRPIRLPHTGNWPSWADERLGLEGEARLLQFQDQLDDLIHSESSPAAISAQLYFRFLPPAGLLPLADPAGARGLTIPGFFFGRTVHGPVFIEGARLHPVMAAAGGFPAIDLEQQEMTWIYLLRENREPATPGAMPPAAAALFVSAHLPFFGDARFDVNRWNYSNFGSLLVR